MSQDKLGVVCRYGGNFVEGPDHKVSYKDGTNRLIYVNPEIDYPTLLSKLLQVCKFADIESIKYQYPTLGLDSLVSVENDEDILYMKEAFSSQRSCPIQLFVSGSPKTLPIHDAIPRYCRIPPKPRIDKRKQIMKEKQSRPRTERPRWGIVISEPGNGDIRRPELEATRRNGGSPPLLSAHSDPFQLATAQVIVSPLVDAIFGNLGSAAMQELRLVCGAAVEKELQSLGSTLSAIQAVLEDAEERQFESKAVQDWLHSLKDVAYDTDDLVDEIVTEAQQSKTAETGTAAGKKRKRSYVSSCLRSCRQDMACRINEMNVRLAKIATEGGDLHLKTRDGSRQLEIIQERRQLFSSVRDESPQVFGREGDREQIIKSLLSDDSGKRGFSVVAIVGIGGVGKTTLAKVVYNDKRITDNFELREWFCVSGRFDSLQQDELRERLIGKKFLLVLDNVRNEVDSHSWERLQVTFAFGAKGSKILVTTQSQAVSDVMRATHTSDLMCLSKKDCWSLFVSEAFHNDNLNAYPDLLKIGVDLVEKCKGLPLAAKALRGLLSSKREVREWENILKSPMWDSQGPASEILPALRLSYQHLPARLKPCFIFCSIFPKDYKFEKERLVQLWVAHGFIRPEEGKQIEDTGSGYFNDLLSRSFFQPHHEEEEEEEEWLKHTKTSYKMNSLFHDLAKFISDNECFQMEQGKSHGNLRKIRHLSYDREPIKFESFYELKGLRTILLLKIKTEIRNWKVADKTFKRLRLIRVLDLSHAFITELPNSIGNLRHLRYLNLSHTEIKELPRSICSIYNMQTLLLTDCYNLVELPDEMRRLTNLRHLDLEGCISIESMPPQIGGLNCLQTLPRFIVGREKERGIAELMELRDIRGKLVIEQLENVTDPEHARQANLRNKPLIDELMLKWTLPLLEFSFGQSEYSDDGLQNEGVVRKEEVEEEVADGLKPHPNLKALGLFGYSSANFPGWMMLMESLLPNLQTLYLSNCRRCSILPPLGGLPSLSSLVIAGMDEVKKIEFLLGSFLSGVFPPLKVLCLRRMRNLEEWRETEGAFPYLGRLCIEDCPQLRQLPFSRLANLTCLKIRRCERLVSLPRMPCLKQLRLHELENLEKWCGVGDGHFPRLQNLSISSCPKVRGWPTILPLLTELFVVECRGFDALPLLPSLCKLHLKGDGSDRLLTSVPYLSSLLSLNIFRIPNLISMPRGIWQALTQLKYLLICDCDKLVTLVEEDEHLPSTLTHLKLFDCDSLESLPRGLHALTSLHTLEIYLCPSLTSLPEEGLPAALQKLTIWRCYMLEERCRKNAGGEDWPKISHVPHVGM